MKNFIYPDVFSKYELCLLKRDYPVCSASFCVVWTINWQIAASDPKTRRHSIWNWYFWKKYVENITNLTWSNLYTISRNFYSKFIYPSQPYSITKVGEKQECNHFAKYVSFHSTDDLYGFRASNKTRVYGKRNVMS